MNKAIFLDRDGVINELFYDTGNGLAETPLVPSQVKLVFGISELIKEAKKLDYLTVIISNQPGVALAKTNEEKFKEVCNEIDKRLEEQGAKLDYHYYCMHHPFAKVEKYLKICNCRKPGIEMFKQASKEHDINLSSSWMIGDGVNDIISGKKAGCKTILLANIEAAENLRILEDQLGEIKPDYIVKKLPKIIEIIKLKS